MFSHGTLIEGATILAVAGIVVRFMGAALRIILAALMGDEGIGLYQMAYPIYSSLLAISTAGIPVAVSKLVAENIALKDFREALRTFRVSLFILTLTGLVFTAVLVVGADYLALFVVKQPRALYPLLAISPAIFLVTVMSALRGFFQGRQKMLPTALSQLLEQGGRVLISVVLVVLLLPAGFEFAAAGAAFGAAFGGLVGLFVLIIIYWRDRPQFSRQVAAQTRHTPSGYQKIISRIFSMAIPITFGSLILPLITLVDLAIVPRQLQAAGFTAERATALYGQLTGMAGSVVYFPNVVIIALGMSLVPAISEAFALKNSSLVANRTAIAIRLTIFFSMPATAGLFVLATPITVLLFNNAEAGLPLAVMAWSVVPLSLYITTTSIMQGLGRPIIPVLYMVFGGAIKSVLAWYLTAHPDLHIGGAALASVVGIAAAAILNIIYLTRLTGWRFRLVELLIRPAVATLVMSAVVYLSYGFVYYRIALPYLTAGRANGMATLVAIVLGVLVYGAALLVTGSLKREELLLIPKAGRYLLHLAERLKLIKS